MKQGYYGERKELDWDLCDFDVQLVSDTKAATAKL
jgi:hypothetical protein